MPQSDQCITCVHYRGALTCDAFPKRIPQEILSGLFDHRLPYPNDRGIRFSLSEAFRKPPGLMDG